MKILLFVAVSLFSFQVFAKAQCWVAQPPTPPEFPASFCFSDISTVVSGGQAIINFKGVEGAAINIALPILIAVVHGDSIKFKVDGPFKSVASADCHGERQSVFEYFGDLSNDQKYVLKNPEISAVHVINKYPSDKCALKNADTEVWYKYVP